MSIEAQFGNLFKPETKSSARRLFADEKVSVASGSDTGIQAYVRVTPPSRVKLASAGIESETFTAECNCPAAKRSAAFCKHVWATLLAVEADYPDFLAGKSAIEKPAELASDAAAPSSGVSSVSEERARARAEASAAYQASAKLRAAEYRKSQYQKQKLRAKEKPGTRFARGGSSGAREAASPARARSFSQEIETALAYFATNGFPMEDGPSESIVSEAKKKLSRVFHPDKGGSHEEMAELNNHCELLLRHSRESD